MDLMCDACECDEAGFAGSLLPIGGHGHLLQNPVILEVSRSSTQTRLRFLFTTKAETDCGCYRDGVCADFVSDRGDEKKTKHQNKALHKS